MGLELGRAYLLLRADTTRLAADIAKGKVTAVNAVKSLSMTLNGLMGALGAGTFVGAMIHMVHAGEEFNQKMRQSLAIIDNVSEELEGKMRKAAFNVAAATKYSASEAAEAYFFLASAGLKAESVLAALPAMAKFAQAGNFDLAKATELATDAQAAMGLAIYETDYASVQKNLENLTRVTDVLTKANTLADATTEQFSLALTRKSAAAARIVGKSLEEVTAVLAAYALQGTKAYQAGQAVNIVWRDLQTKAIKNKKAFKAFGLAIFDANGEMRHTADIVGDLEKKLAGMSDEQKKAALYQLGFADKSLIYLQTLIGTSKQIRQFDEELQKAGGTTEKVANKQLTLLQKATARLGSTATWTGNKLTEAFGTSIAVAMEGIRIAIEGLGAAFSGFHGKVLAATAAVTGFTLSLRLLSVAASIAGLSLKRMILVSGFGTIFLTVGAAVAGIMELVKWLYKTSNVQKAITETSQMFADSWARLSYFIKTAGESLSKFITDFLKSSMGINFDLGRIIKEAAALGIHWVAKLTETVTTFLAGLAMDWPAAWEFAKTAMMTWGFAVKDVLDNAGGILMKFVDKGIRYMAALGLQLTAPFSRMVLKIAEVASAARLNFMNVFGFFSDMAKGIVGQVKPMMIAILTGLGAIPNNVGKIVTSVLDLFTTLRDGVFAVMKEMVLSAIDSVVSITPIMSKLPLALAKAAATGSMAPIDALTSDMAAELDRIGVHLAITGHGVASNLSSAIDAVAEANATMVDEATTGFDRAYEAAGGTAAADATREAIAAREAKLAEDLRNNADYYGSAMDEVNSRVQQAWDSFSDLELPGLDGLFDMSSLTGTAFDSLSEQFDAIMGRGMFALFGDSAKDAGKKAADVIEEEIAGDPIDLKVKPEFVGFLEFSKNLQLAILESQKNASEAASTAMTDPLVEAEEKKQEEKNKRKERSATRMREAEERRAETNRRFWDFVSGKGTTSPEDVAARSKAMEEDQADIRAGGVGDDLHRRRESRKFWESVTGGKPGEDQLLDGPNAGNFFSSKLSPSGTDTDAVAQNALKEAEKQTSFQEKMLAALSKPLKIEQQPLVLT